MGKNQANLRGIIYTIFFLRAVNNNINVSITIVIDTYNVHINIIIYMIHDT